MKKNSMRTWKTILANVLVAVMIMLSVMIEPTTVTKAAVSAPKLTKATRNIFIGKQYDLNVANKIKGSTYVWSTSNKKVATVTQKGIVKGNDKGTATITCKVTTKSDTYKLSCKVTIMKPSTGLVINSTFPS